MAAVRPGDFSGDIQSEPQSLLTSLAAVSHKRLKKFLHYFSGYFCTRVAYRQFERSVVTDDIDHNWRMRITVRYGVAEQIGQQLRDTIRITKNRGREINTGRCRLSNDPELHGQQRQNPFPLYYRSLPAWRVSKLSIAPPLRQTIYRSWE